MSDNENVLQRLWGGIKRAFADVGVVDRRIKQVESWDGSASRWDSTDAYCSACLIDVNGAAGRDEKAQSHCMLPVREPGDSAETFVWQAVTAAAGGRGITRVERPDDVPEDAWNSAMVKAANAIIRAYSENDEVAPDSVYEIAGREAPERSISGSRLYEQVHSALMQNYGEQWPWLYDLFFDNGRAFAIYSTEGKLYQCAVEMTGETVALGEPVQVTEQFTPVRTRSTVVRQTNGKYRWFSVSATSVLNRVGEIDSRELFDSFVENFDADNPPERQFYHLGSKTRMGVIDFVARDGNALITSGVYDENNPLAEADIAAKKRNPDYWGESIRYMPTTEPEIVEIAGVKIPVYRAGKLIESSTLPESDAANLFTNSRVLEVVMNDKTKQALLELVGDDDELRERVSQFIGGVDETNRAISDSGVVTRDSDGDSPEPESRTAEQTNIEVDDELVSVIARKVVEELSDADAENETNEKMQSLAEQVRDLQATAQGLVSRLAQVEKSDDQKRQEWHEDLPRKQARRASYRPREAHADTGDDNDDEQLTTMADRAEQAPGRRY